MTNHFSWHGTPREVPLVPFFAPRPFGIPVPRLNEQLRVLAVGHRLPSGREDLVYGFGREVFLGCGGLNAIDTGAERLIRNEGIRRLRGLNSDSLGSSRGQRHQETKQ